MNRETRVGLMFTLSLLILGTTLYYLGNFQETVNYQIRFAKVNGLAVDSPVHFNGVPIGRVTKIVLGDEVSSQGLIPIIVSIAVHRSAREHIRVSTIADIKSIGVLGDKYILLLTKDYNADSLEEGGFIKPTPKTVDVERLLEQGTDFVADVSDITKDLKAFLVQLTQKEGLLQKLVGDEELAQQLKSALSETARKLESREGLVSVLLTDPQFTAEFKQRFRDISGGMSEMIENYQEGDGLVPSLMTDAQFRDDFKQKTLDLLDTSQSYMNRISQSRGLLYTLTEDEEYGQRVSQNIEKATYHLASILEKIDRGEGTASLLVNDPSLYQGLYQVVYGLEHSGISKWYIQRKRKKGAKLLDDPQREEESP
ncbi:MCE family protein [Sulfidibacter corallicola]|uniref:MCE family protein n=1 Tax=Sulfidibacter corallicola TaxID=2818388 RepID=A0A8A4TWQ3_SULCO|nr:MlaD family protein [Sulfidibacter corallicola]QTD53621.1 MCE family protein [Sulfidibacter corallicola]